MINAVNVRAHVELTVIVDVSEVPDLKFSQHYMIRPNQLMIKYTHSPADHTNPKPYYHRTITVYGRYVLKSGELGQDRRHVNFYDDAKTPAWVLESEAANRPDWSQLVVPGK